jgi:uncharacterized membrane protein
VHRSTKNRHAPFGDDGFGRAAERIARFFGTPGYLAAQSALVVAWIAFNAAAFGLRWDPYPFILLNLAFSTQAAYAAPLILLAQTRQADRDKFAAQEAEERHHQLELHQEREAARTLELLEANTALTRQTEALAEQIARLGGTVLRVSGDGADPTLGSVG